MSQSSVSEQVEELKSIGMPVRKGTRMTAPNSEVAPLDPHQIGSDMWLARWSRNAFRNYPTVTRSLGIRFLAEAAKGLPAFVIGVGPSLDDAIGELKGLKRRALLISTDAAFRTLLANGIMPDLVISYDCKDEQNLLWQDVPKHSVPMVFSTCAHPDVIQSWPGPVLFYNQFHQQDDLCKRILPSVFPEIGQIPSGGTVGNMACFLAHVLGCKPICAVGMDFCFQPAKADIMAWRYRAQDYHYVTPIEPGIPPRWEKTEIKALYDNDERVKRSFLVKGDDGKGFRVDPELEFYGTSFTELMSHFEVPILNCTPNGRIPALFPVSTVEAAVKDHCKTEWQGGRTVLDHLGRIVP